MIFFGIFSEIIIEFTLPITFLVSARKNQTDTIFIKGINNFVCNIEYRECCVRINRVIQWSNCGNWSRICFRETLNSMCWNAVKLNVAVRKKYLQKNAPTMVPPSSNTSAWELWYYVEHQFEEHSDTRHSDRAVVRYWNPLFLETSANERGVFFIELALLPSLDVIVW